MELKEDGANIPVTDANKEEYIRLITDFTLTKAIEKQIAAFLDGFRQLIPEDLIRLFNEQVFLSWEESILQHRSFALRN